MTLAPLLEARSLKKWFSSEDETSFLLQGIDLVVEQNRSYSIMGRSGAGKTTLLQILATIDTPSDGELFFQGQNVALLDKEALRNSSFGFVFQSFYLLEERSVIDNVLLPASLAGRKFSHLERAYRLLDRCGLLQKKDHLASVLSGGEKQRVALARALLLQPKLLFLDEPTGSLDKQSEQAILSLIFETAQQEASSLILVTHNEALAKQADHHFRLENGFLYESDI